MTAMMKAAIFVEPGRIELADKPIPDVGPNDALQLVASFLEVEIICQAA